MNVTCTGMAFSTSQIAAMAKSLYTSGSFGRRKMQQLRPYACPLEVLLSFLPEQGSMLDVGCGSGLFLGLALLSGRAITGSGVDISASALALAFGMRDTGLPSELRGNLTLQRVHTPDDWPAARFDIVSFIDVMHHVPREQQAEMFKAVAARVKPGGILLYKDMVRRPRWRALLNWLHDLVVAREWIHYYPIAKIDDAAEEFGFIATYSETVNRLWYGHELRVYRQGQQPLAGRT
jgi:SAM-dependent methyltransferase